ncbi:hypothetical protein D6855_14255 [Butyrivibrio sp. CB08]|uniref:hypothetical protein n=1 Tax=Butyrivibrio sp. CB08 TaxID=2364879 RepID=UPI000EA8A1B9|nr:hypothetical protein [Butyrivibrio sp. CB08]RKM56827.1 hypothetical protein D6855_14255 [Butyrivibrio sp. CB08]
MWTGKKLNADYPILYEIEVCCDTEKCDVISRKYPIDYVDEWTVKVGSVEYSRFDMAAVKAVKVTDRNRIHVKIMYLSEDQTQECLGDIHSWIKRYGSPEVIGIASGTDCFKGL